MHVTVSACEALSKLLARRAVPDRCLRLNTTQGNYRFVIDAPIEHDIAFRFEERVVLVVSETVSRDLWGIVVDASIDEGKSKLIFRKARPGEPHDSLRDDAAVVPAQWRAGEHERLLAEIADIGRQIASLRGGSKSMLREQLQALEAKKQEKWDAVRALWAGDGGWHKLQSSGAGNTAPTGALASKRAD